MKKVMRPKLVLRIQVFFSAKVNFVAEAEKTGFTSCYDAVLGSNETGLVRLVELERAQNFRALSFFGYLA